MNQILEKLRKIEEEVAELRRRVEKLEGGSKNEILDRIFRMQKEVPTVEGYDIWSVIIAKEKGSPYVSTGCFSTAGIPHNLPPEDLANLSLALAHPARIVLLKELRTSKYASELEKMFSDKYGALYHHLSVLRKMNMIRQEKERGKYAATVVGVAALLFLNMLASMLNALKKESSENRSSE
ncbi:helix-turn-helix transcriptional regulator [Candidatus Bathyarchaeota archaeon]|nr:helix-turn-helix transcriptional regulator [Candidatus Bathyarchaeota archaeon]